MLPRVLTSCHVAPPSVVDTSWVWSNSGSLTSPLARQTLDVGQLTSSSGTVSGGAVSWSHVVPPLDDR